MDYFYIGIVVLLLIILTIFIFTVVRYIVKNNVSEPAIYSSPNNQGGTVNNRMPDFYGPKRRKDFRITIGNLDCVVELLEFENKKLDKLSHKRFEGSIENISATGLKLLSRYNLPVNQKILIEISFNLEGEEFCIVGEIIRKEEHTHKNTYSYGIHFIGLDENQLQLLIRVLNKITLERRNLG